ncbi:MAG TPA: hypothetical protein VFM98_05905 [Ramlibacter sp.]|uniref:hypothetical protein n=1 Tax=Ramlibacter sp. TaxID=1917967 RepID=UPI002D7FB073|nr:hypothetical protein [Ramlibacter sp.]HET8745116.1 hypothetical protein [Ramlibacter sp.]
MNENEDKEARARHGYRNEVSWDGGKGRQPYGNQEEQHGPAAAHETEAGNRGPASGRNVEDDEAFRGFPEPPEKEAPREDRSGRGGVS